MFTQVTQTTIENIAQINWTGILSFLLITAGIYALLLAVKKIALKRLIKSSLAQKSELLRFVVQLIISFRWPLYLSLAIVSTQQIVPLPFKTGDIPSSILAGVFIYYLAQTINQFIKLALERYIQNQKKQREGFDTTVIKLIRQVLQVLVWLIAAALFLQNIGLQITTILGGLGIAGIAIAFGVRNILEDIISYFTIFFDKPFRPGDYIVINEGGGGGTVKRISIKSTTLKTLRGEKLIISNKELTQSIIKNFSDMEKRRDVIELTISQNTKPNKLEKLPEIIKQIVESQEHAEFDRVYFKQIKDTGYLFSITYYIDSGEYDPFANTKKQINLQIVKKLAAEEIKLAHYPQKSILNELNSEQNKSN